MYLLFKDGAVSSNGGDSQHNICDIPGIKFLICSSALSELIVGAFGYAQKRVLSSGVSALGLMSRRSTDPLAVVIMRGKILASNKV
jgi:hypothetical protein